MGRILRFVPSKIRSFKLVTPSSFNSFKPLIITKPFNTATPNNTIKPTPAEMLKGISRNHNATTPPMVAIGIAMYIIKVCGTDFKAKYISTKISSKAIGTTVCKRLLARSKFSKAPP